MPRLRRDLRTVSGVCYFLFFNTIPEILFASYLVLANYFCFGRGRSSNGMGDKIKKNIVYQHTLATGLVERLLSTLSSSVIHPTLLKHHLTTLPYDLFFLDMLIE